MAPGLVRGRYEHIPSLGHPGLHHRGRRNGRRARNQRLGHPREPDGGATAALDEPADQWAAVRFDMRDAIVTGTAPSQDAVDTIVAKVAAVHGVRSVISQAIVAEHASPFPLVVTVEGGALKLAGGYPDQSAHEELLAAAESGIVDATRPMSGAPGRDEWLATARYAIEIAGQLDEGEVALSDLDVSVSGRARNAEAYAELGRLLEQGAPHGRKAHLS